MAKKKRGPTKGARAEESKADRADSVRIRVSGSYKDWLVRFADAERSDMSDLIDDALAAHAKARGFEAPPKR